MPEARWYAVRYNLGVLRAERTARPALRQLGFPTFWPAIRLRVPDARCGHRTTTVAAFPGYLFAQWAPGADWPQILRQPGILARDGILRRVGRSTEPMPMPPGQIEAWLRRAGPDGVIEDASAPIGPAPLQVGASLRVAGGPFAGALGLCLLDGAERVQVLLEIMGAARPVTVPRGQVEPA